MRLALYQPDIAQNTGTILRLAACFGLGLGLYWAGKRREATNWLWDQTGRSEGNNVKRAGAPLSTWNSHTCGAKVSASITSESNVRWSGASLG